MARARGVLAMLAFVVPCVAATAQGQTPARVLVGFPPGGNVDASARLFAEKLAEATGRAFVVENRTGATGQIALMALKAAAPDGSTLSVVPDASITIYPHTVATPAYDTLRDFVPIAHLGAHDFGLAVAAHVPAKDLREWLNWVKSDSKNAVYGSSGVGTIAHFLGLILAQATGVPLVNVPYRGVAPALADLVAGQVPSAVLSLGGLARQAKSGKIRLLAHTHIDGRRSSMAPGVPSFKELGYTALEVSGWFGLIGPAGMRPEVVARYNDIIVQAQRTRAVRERMRAMDLEPREMAPAALAARIQTEHDRWGPVVKASGYRKDDQ